MYDFLKKIHMKTNQLFNRKISGRKILLIAILLFTNNLMAQEWYIWKLTSPCRDSRQDWFSVAKTFPGYGFDITPSAGPMDFSIAMPVMDAFKMGQGFANYCCLWDVYKNNQTGAFTVSKQLSSLPPPSGFILFRTGLCCEDAFTVAGFVEGIDCRSLRLSTGVIVNIQSNGTFRPFTPTNLFPPNTPPINSLPPNNINCWPGSTASFNPITNKMECFCNTGLVWNITRTACVDPKELVQNFDCSSFPGSYAAWNSQNQRVECFCPTGKVWNATRTACVDPKDLFLNSDCSVYPGSYAAWNNQNQRVECICPIGKVWNSSRTACIDIEPSVNCPTGSSFLLNPITNEKECRCNEGLVWNETKTECIKPKNDNLDPSSRLFIGTWNGLGNAKGITIIIKDDLTMSFTDTRPGYERSGKGKWGLDASRVNCIFSPLNYALWFSDGKLSDPWGNFYVK